MLLRFGPDIDLIKYESKILPVVFKRVAKLQYSLHFLNFQLQLVDLFLYLILLLFWLF